MGNKRRSSKPLYWGIFIAGLFAVFIAASGCFRSEPEDPDYPGVASSPMLRRVVSGDGALKMVVPSYWDVEKPSGPAVLRGTGGEGEFVLESRAAVADRPADVERELSAAAAGWRSKGFEVSPGLLKVSSAGGIPFYYRRGSRPGDASPTLIFGLLLPAGAASHYYLYSTGFPHHERLGGETLTVVRTVRLVR